MRCSAGKVLGGGKMLFAVSAALLGLAHAETEPNDTPADAEVLALGSGPVSGVLGSNDQDVYEILITDGPKLLRTEIVGPDEAGGLFVLTSLTRNASGDVTDRKDLLSANMPPFRDEAVTVPEAVYLEGGTYYIGLVPLAGGDGAYRLTASVEAPAPLPTPLQMGLWGGRLTGEEQCLTVPSGLGATDLTLYSTHGESDLVARLRDAEGSSRTPRRAVDGRWSISNLVAGDWSLCLDGDDGAPFAIEVNTPSSAAGQQIVHEPNEEEETAFALDAGTRYHGRIDRRGGKRFEDDVFSLPAGTVERPVYIEINGKSGSRLTYDLRRGDTSRRVSFGHSTEIGPLVGAPYTMALSSSAPDQYSLRARIEEALEPGEERELNDDLRSASPLSPNRTAYGESIAGDDDYYSFDTGKAPQLWRVQVNGNGLDRLEVLDGGGETLVDRQADSKKSIRINNLYLLPGKHFLRVVANGTYRLRAIPQGGRKETDEYEPNDSARVAERLSIGERRVAGLDDADDQDLYRFEVRAPEWLEITISPPLASAVTVTLEGAESRLFRESVADADEEFRYVRRFEPGAYVLEVEPDGQVPLDDYGIAVSPFDNPFGPEDDQEPSPATELSVDLRTEERPRAYLSGQRQILPMTIGLKGTLGDEVSVKLTASEPGWALGRMSFKPSDDGGLTGNAAVIVPPLAAERPVRLGLRIRSGDAVGTARTTVTPDAFSPALSPERAFALPSALIGGMNVASARNGGRLVGPSGGEFSGEGPFRNDPHQLIDSLNPTDGIFAWREGYGEASFAFDLTGDEPVPLAGVVFNTRSMMGVTSTLREFRLEASPDGREWQEVLVGRLDRRNGEQAFSFDETVKARLLRLVPLNAHTDGDENPPLAYLNEFKAIAERGATPSGLSGRNIADPALGGHMTWSSVNMFPSQGWGRPLLEGEQRKPVAVRVPDGRLSMVMQFHQTRIADISGVTLRAFDDADPIHNASSPTSVTIKASTESPFGPWREVGSFPLDPEAAADIRFDSEVPARFLMLTLEAGAEVERMQLFDKIEIFEAPSTPEAPSILAEWGEFSTLSAYQLLRADRGNAATAPKGGATASAAKALPFGLTVASTVQRGAHEDHWSLDVVEAPALILADLSTEESGGAAPRLTAANGSSIPMVRSENKDQLKTARGTLWEATVPSAGTYDLQVYEPKRAIVIAFDSSGSVAPYRDTLNRALRDIARDVEPGEEQIAFLPLGGKLFPEGFSDDPELLLRELNAYDESDSSSAAESTLKKAAMALRDKPGVKGVLMLTDAATSADDSLWPVLDEVRPVVVSLAISSAGAGSSDVMLARSLMQSWAAAGGGFYSFIGSQSEFADDFRRAAVLLRGPKNYTLRVKSIPVGQLAPGQLSVTAPEDGGKTGSASSILVLLDTSGSMLARLEGETRISVARNALRTLLRDPAVADSAVGVRTFGLNTGECGTVLKAGFGASREEVMEAVEGVRVKVRSKTPIAEAIGAAQQDLADHAGEVRILLLTDGEETCDGDPAAAISALREAHPAGRIDIIGFELNDAATADIFANWARLGGGTYLDAQGSAGLRDALVAAVARRFEAISASGDVFAGTINGPALTLPSGTYSIRYEGSADIVETATVSPAQKATVVLDD